MSSNKDSDDVRQYLPDLESIRREADPAVAERKLQQALNNPELDRALSEMQQQKPTGQPLFQFPVVPAVPHGQQAAPQGPSPLPGVGAQHGAVGPPPLPGAAAQQGAAVARQGAAVAHHAAAAAQQGAAAAHHASAAAHPRAAVPLYGGAAAPLGAAMPGAVVPRSTVAQQGAMAPSQWADRTLPPIDKSLLPSSLLPITPPPVATPKTPASAPATAKRRPWMPRWLMVVLVVFAVSMPFVLAALLLREAPPKEQQPAPPSSGAPARSAMAQPAASELPAPVAPTPPAEAEPSLDDVATEGEPPAPAPTVPARPVGAAPRLPQAPAAPVPTERPLADDVME
ncbi:MULTISPECIES: hypothetical protein [Sorangium]|uniref:Uncharacterized protein n=1 Tax=Sorangium cellulosum TaxID=56 RepID=A0A4P2QH33_SORCE|nr:MULTISPECIES: hypothetical protein [Sorangium]AUX28838.1 hypothetical protein SOCE836_009230 [Sorangium cellulosum]WCQ88236.1 hypothetical protein NQZ70_00911 [Sorangium sp. Soce836]